MVVAARIVAVRAEESAFAVAKGDAEVVVRRVHRPAHVFHVPTARRGERGAVDVEAAHSGVSVAREIEHAVGAHVGKPFVAGRVNHVAKVFERAYAFLKIDSPQVFAALSAGHIA